MDIPRPNPSPGRPSLYPWRAMKVGDMFFVPNRDRNTMTSLAGATGVRLGRKFSTRLCWMYRPRMNAPWQPCMAPRGCLGIGVWRIK